MLNDIPVIKDILIFLKLKDIHNYLLCKKVNSNEISHYEIVKKDYIDKMIDDMVIDFIPKNQIYTMPLMFFDKKISYDCYLYIDKKNIKNQITFGFDINYNPFYIIKYFIMNLTTNHKEIKYVCIFKHRHNLWSCTSMETRLSTNITTFDQYNKHFIFDDDKGKVFNYVKAICNNEELVMNGSILYKDYGIKFKFNI